MNETSTATTLPIVRSKKHVAQKPLGFIEDPEERRRLVEELAGSMPELPPVEEFLRRRRQS